LPNWTAQAPVYYDVKKDSFIPILDASCPQFLNADIEDTLFLTSPRGSGINSVTEKRASYDGSASSASKGSTFTISLTTYLTEIKLTLLEKGKIAAADQVQVLIDDYAAGKISSSEALDLLQKINFT